MSEHRRRDTEMTDAIDVRQRIDRPVDEVWAAPIDWDNAHRWMPGTDELHANGPTEVGPMLSFHARGKDRPSEVVALEPGR